MHYSINNAEVSIQDQQFYECAVKEFRLKLLKKIAPKAPFWRWGSYSPIQTLFSKGVCL